MSNPNFDQGYPNMLAGVSEEALQTFLISEPLANPSVFRTVMGGPESTEDIVSYLRENNRFSYVNDYITQQNFPLTGNKAWEEEIVIHDPGRSFSENEGLAILKQEGLLRPTYENALRFARQHGTATTSKKKPYVIFLHQPWQGPDRYRRVLCVDRDADYRELYLNYSGGRFHRGCVLAGVRPRKQLISNSTSLFH